MIRNNIIIQVIQTMLDRHIEPKNTIDQLLQRLSRSKYNNDDIQQCLQWIENELIVLRNPYNRSNNKDPKQLTLFDCGAILIELGKNRKVKDDPLCLINRREMLKTIQTFMTTNKQFLLTYGDKQ